MGLFAGRRGIPVWTLEHDPEWYEHIAAALRRFRIEGVELVFAPLRDYGDYSWYDVPMERMPERFGVVVCDGPPQKTTPGDRYGLLPVMQDRLGPGDAGTGSGFISLAARDPSILQTVCNQTIGFLRRNRPAVNSEATMWLIFSPISALQ
jgi:hypothetical protein